MAPAGDEAVPGPVRLSRGLDRPNNTSLAKAVGPDASSPAAAWRDPPQSNKHGTIALSHNELQ